MATLKELMDDPMFQQLAEEDQQRAITEFVPNFEESMGKFKSERQALDSEERRSKRVNVPETGPVTQLASGIEGVGESAFAGMPRAAERILGGPGSVEAQDSEFSATSEFPQTYEGGKLVGNFVPLGRGLKLASDMKRAPGKILELAKEGYRLGGVYGAGAGLSQSTENEEVTPEEALQDTIVGTAIGAPVGAFVGTGGALGSKLVSKFVEPNVAKEAQVAEKRALEALRQGVEMYEKRGTATSGEHSVPSTVDLSKIEGALKRGAPLVYSENPKINNFDDFREAGSTVEDKLLKGIDKKLTSSGNKGVVVSGDDIAMDNLKSVFPTDFLGRLSSTQTQQLDQTLGSLLKFRGKEYKGAGLEGLARMVLAKKGPFPGLSPEARTDLVKQINNVSRQGEKLSGEQLFQAGLKHIYPVDISMTPEGITALADSSRRFTGKELKPWELNDRIKEINAQLDSIYSQKPTPQKTSMADFEVKALEREAKSLRNRLYSAVSSYPGEMQEQKLDLGALLELNEAARTAGVGEKLDPSTSPGFRAYLDRIFHRQNWLATGASAIGVRGNRDLTPSQRLKIASGAYAKSVAGSKPQSGGAKLVSSVSKSGVKSPRPVTRLVAMESAKNADEDDDYKKLK